MNEYVFLFCSNPLNSREVDFDYKDEYESACELGYDTIVFSYEDLVYFDKVPIIKSDRKKIIYRGWMLKENYYERLYRGLYKQGYKLINTPEEYINCHHIDKWYKKLEGITPKTKWIEKDKINEDTIEDALMLFGNNPLIIKDYVKSRKHEWLDSFYIPNGIEFNNSKKVVRNFINRQGEDLAGGLVFREFIKLQQTGYHSKSKMPIVNEVRIFILNKEIIATINYWDGSKLNIDFNEIDEILEYIKEIESNFFTVDIAKTAEGKWILIELGDGQVSGLQEYSANKFYLIATIANTPTSAGGS